MDATLFKAIIEGGALVALVAVVALVLRFFFERLKAWGTFAEKVADNALVTMARMQDLIAANTQSQQKMSDSMEQLCDQMKDEHAELLAEIKAQKRKTATGKPLAAAQ